MIVCQQKVIYWRVDFLLWALGERINPLKVVLASVLLRRCYLMKMVVIVPGPSWMANLMNTSWDDMTRIHCQIPFVDPTKGAPFRRNSPNKVIVNWIPREILLHGILGYARISVTDPLRNEYRGKRTTCSGNDDKQRRRRRRTHQLANSSRHIVHLLFDFGPKTKQNTDEDAFTATKIQAQCEQLEQDKKTDHYRPISNSVEYNWGNPLDEDGRNKPLARQRVVSIIRYI